MTNEATMNAYRAAHNIPETVELRTYAGWLVNGYKVRHGEASHHRIMVSKKVGNRWCKKETSFFTSDQVDRIDPVTA